MKGVSGFVGARLTQAREARGLTKKSLSESLDISATALSDLETGRFAPRQETLSKVSAVLGFSERFFLRAVPDMKFGPVFWRKQASEPLRSQEKTRQRLEWAGEAYLALSEFVDFPKVKLPFFEWLPNDWRLISDEQIETLAEECRSAWGLGDHPIPDMILAVENMGLPVLVFDIESEKQSGYCTWSENLGFPIIGVNSTECSLARQRFNVAHELGHVLMHLPIANDADVRNTALHKAMEDQAHRFAGALLLPRRVLAQKVKYFDFEELLEVKGEYGISICAQIVRSKQLGYIRDDHYAELWSKAGQRRFRKPLGEPLDKNSKLEAPRMLGRAIEALSATSELLLERVRTSLELPRVEEIRIFGRSLEVAADNVVRLRPFS